MFTRLLHTTIHYLKLEFLFIYLKNYFNFFYKLIPTPDYYKKGRNKIVVRSNIIFNLDLYDYMQWYIYADLPDLSWVKAQNYLKDNACIIDIGANCGAFSLKLAERIYAKGLLNCKIIAFEPNPYIYKKLEENLRLNTHLVPVVKPHLIGLGNKGGSFEMIFNEHNSGGGKVILDLKTSLDKRIKIEMKTLDNFTEEQNLSNISFIKIDVEGLEPLVIEGGKKTIEQHKPALYIEMTDKWFKEHGYSQHDIISYLKHLNYQLYAEINGKFVDLSSIPSLDKIEQYNLLAITK